MHNHPRHEGHLHTVNVKYGYAVFLLSLVHVAVLVIVPRLGNWATKSPRKSLPWIPQIVIWAILLAILGTWNIHEWLEHFSVSIKRFGRLAYCLLPVDILLAYKYWPFENYLQNLNLHKWMSRIIVVCSLIHGVGFLVKWLVEGTFFHHVFEVDNLLGVVVFAAAAGLLVVSVAAFRRQSYRLFYVSHNITIGLFVVLILFHARPSATLFVAICALLLAILVFIKFQTYTATPVSLREVPNSSLVLVSFPWPHQTSPFFQPGSHVRINHSNRSWKSWVFASHPFTAATLPETSETLDLVVKKSTFTFAKDTQYNLSSPYTSLFFNDNLVSRFEHTVIVCGGSGISLAIPVFKYLVTKLDVTMIWCTRSSADLFVLRHYSLLDNVQVYITGSEPVSVEDESEGHGLMQETIELENLEETSKNSEATKGPELVRGRPDLNKVLAGLETAPDSSCVISCGPRSLVRDCENWCRKHKVESITEIYEM